MGGPGIGVLLPQRLTVDDRQWIVDRLDEARVYQRPLDFAPSPIDGVLKDPDSLAPLYVEQEFGFWPLDEVDFWSGSKQPEDHRLLAELALDTAIKFAGIIDFSGALIPERLEIPLTTRQGYPVEWSKIEPFVIQIQAKIRGKIVSVPYTTVNLTTWVHHLADVTFLQNWMKHPYFHLIK
jgi:hypothetical protein